MAHSDKNDNTAVCWQYSDEFSETNLHLLENDILSDISFAAGEEKTIIRAHKMILASRSPVFFAMFCGLLKETSTVVDIPDIKPDIFTLFLKYLYTRSCDTNENTVTSLLYCAKKYDVPSLQKICRDFLRKAINPVNVCTVLEESLLFQEDQLKEECISFISQNTIAVLKTRSFKNLSSNAVKLLLKDDALNCKEIHIYSALKEWGVCACHRKGKIIPSAESIRDEIGDLIKLIRFPTMSVEDFSKYVAKDLVLTPEEKLASYQDIVLGEKVSGYPNTPRQEPTTLCRVMRFRSITTRNRSKEFQYDCIGFTVSGTCTLGGAMFFRPATSGMVTGKLIVRENKDKVLLASDVSIDFKIGMTTFDHLFSPILLEPGKIYYILHKGKMTGQCVKSYCGTDPEPAVDAGNVRIQFKNVNYSTNNTTVSTGEFLGLFIGVKAKSGLGTLN
ncbi:BTB/POZ domain-containing protein 6-B-like isoform X1 [Mya arenaria]|uniref:BTB/POZ domain-containing protein 6-B-like isoform X1 n=1 Tax=Mya arenaria TaxID=6604 RepID=UPI0022E58997|nr:BTB/POZ domain-containing protein 6-B-like isoform X1 [Mya arenaria]